MVNDLNEAQAGYEDYAPSISALNLELQNYAPINHNHDSTYASINHVHDERYALLTNVVSEIQNIAAENNKIPNIQAIKAYCSDFLTPAALSDSLQLQNLIRGKSAFEVWAEQQPVRYAPREAQAGYEEDDEEEAQAGCEEIPYTFNDYLSAITGPQGEQGT